MKSTNWKGIAELIGIGAIVASLIFVGMEMRQTRMLAVAAAYQSRADTEIAIELAVLQHEGLSLLREKYATGQPNTEADNRLFGRELQIRFIDYENVHFQWLNGMVTNELWAVYRSGIKDYLNSPVGTNWWRNQRLFWRESFRHAVDDIVAEIEGATSE